MKVGEVLRALRIERGMTQEALALEAGLTTGYLSRIERGERQAQEATLRKLAAGLGTTLTKLYAEVDGKERGTGAVQLREKEAQDYEPDAVKLRALLRQLTPYNRRLALEFVRLLHRLQ